MCCASAASDVFTGRVVDRGFELAAVDVSAVVVGLDREFIFDKLARAQTALLGGATFIGTNTDQMLRPVPASNRAQHQFLRP